MPDALKDREDAADGREPLQRFLAHAYSRSTQFLLSRHLLRTRIQRALAARPALAMIQRAVNRDAFRLQVLLRLTPLNPATVSYLLGAAGVRFPGFLIACLAIAPHLFIEVYFGHAGRYVVQMVGNHRRTAHLHDLVLLGSFAACIVLMVMASRMARRAVLQVVAEPDGEGTRRSAAS